jgi:hypothetical protein
MGIDFVDEHLFGWGTFHHDKLVSLTHTVSASSFPIIAENDGVDVRPLACANVDLNSAEMPAFLEMRKDRIVGWGVFCTHEQKPPFLMALYAVDPNDRLSLRVEPPDATGFSVRVFYRLDL